MPVQYYLVSMFELHQVTIYISGNSGFKSDSKMKRWTRKIQGWNSTSSLFSLLSLSLLELFQSNTYFYFWRILFKKDCDKKGRRKRQQLSRCCVFWPAFKWLHTQKLVKILFFSHFCSICFICWSCVVKWKLTPQSAQPSNDHT